MEIQKESLEIPLYCYIVDVDFFVEFQSEKNISRRNYNRSNCNWYFIYFQYVYMSQRFVPEAVNFLLGLLYLASKKDPKKSMYDRIDITSLFLMTESTC